MTDETEMRAFAAALDGQYALEREIGRGGMGVVYLARDLKLDRPVAIKTLPAHLAEDPRVRERFLREARTAAALSHPNIVPIHRADELGGRVFFVMGYVDGTSLAQRVLAGGPLAVRDTLVMLRDVALALGYAHDHRIVHRDVKAENILLEREGADGRLGHALVTDFGIARTAEAAPLTATGHVLGSVYYMSPEQVAGEALDGRSDLYSLGIVGYYALSGRFPFESETASAVLVAHVTKPSPSVRDAVPGVVREAAAVIDRCLAKSPAERYQSAGDLAAALDDVLSRLPSDATPVRPAAVPPAIISEAEAQEIWQRAAELQTDTGARAAIREAPPADDQPPRKPATLTTGYRLDQVRAAAEEAGIGADFLERALEEHGLVKTTHAVTPVEPTAAPARTTDATGGGFIREDLPEHINPFVGTATRIAFTASLQGEVAEEDLYPLVDQIRRSVDEVGHVGLVGRSLTWSVSNHNRKLDISVVPRGGRTTIRVDEVLTPLSGRVFGSLMGSSVSVGIVLLGVFAGRLGNPAAGVAAAATVAGTAFLTARGLFGFLSDRRRRRLRELVERLAAQVADSMSRGPKALVEGDVSGAPEHGPAPSITA